MGWDVTPISRGIKTKAYIEWELSKRSDWEVVKLLEGKAVGGYKPFFAAIKKGEKVFGVVIVTKRRNGFISEKWIGEDEGPGQVAPASLIQYLTPTDSEWANEWRAKSLGQAVA